MSLSIPLASAWRVDQGTRSVTAAHGTAIVAPASVREGQKKPTGQGSTVAGVAQSRPEGQGFSRARLSGLVVLPGQCDPRGHGMQPPPPDGSATHCEPAEQPCPFGVMERSRHKRDALTFCGSVCQDLPSKEYRPCNRSHGAVAELDGDVVVRLVRGIARISASRSGLRLSARADAKLLFCMQLRCLGPWAWCWPGIIRDTGTYYSVCRFR